MSVRPSFSLEILPDSDRSNTRFPVGHQIETSRTDSPAAKHKQKRDMPWHTVIRMVCVLSSQATSLEQDSSADVVIARHCSSVITLTTSTVILACHTTTCVRVWWSRP
jgi:hypothetical protein